MRQIVDGVFELRVGFVNVHLVVVDDGVVLIDTGLPGRRAAPRIQSALYGVRRAVGDVTVILLTHKHPDHTGGVAELRRRSGARVVAHEADAPVITGAAAPVLKPVQRIGAIFMPMPQPSPVDDLLAGDSTVPVPGFRAVHTPGHTPGGVCFYAKDLATVFTGDTLLHGGPSATGRSFSDGGVLLMSITDRLLSLPRQTIVKAGHGDDTTIADERSGVLTALDK